VCVCLRVCGCAGPHLVARRRARVLRVLEDVPREEHCGLVDVGSVLGGGGEPLDEVVLAAEAVQRRL
jgi:hypothetical protein